MVTVNSYNNDQNQRSGADSMGHGAGALTLLKWLGTGGHEQNRKGETEQTVLTITKALTETTNCTSRAKKWSGHDQKQFFRRFATNRCPPPPLSN